MELKTTSPKVNNRLSHAALSNLAMLVDILNANLTNTDQYQWPFYVQKLLNTDVLLYIMDNSALASI